MAVHAYFILCLKLLNGMLYLAIYNKLYKIPLVYTSLRMKTMDTCVSFLV